MNLSDLSVLEVLCAALGIISLQARTIWKLVRERNYCRELCLREQRLHMQKQSETSKNSIAQHNETLRIVLTAFAAGEPITLDDLLSSAERDWSLKSSKTPSGRKGP